MNQSELLLVTQNMGAKVIEFMSTFFQPVPAKAIADFQNFLSFLPANQVQDVLTSGENFVKAQLATHFPGRDLLTLLPIFVWTTNLLYKQINSALGNGLDIRPWVPFLHHFIWGVKDLYIYVGKGYRGFKKHRNLAEYKVGQTVCWKTISALSKNISVAEAFTDPSGMIFEVEITSAHDISKLSMFPTEEEVVLLPYSYFDVIEVTDIPGKPAYVKLREVSVPRALQVIFWVDDKPSNNLQYIWEVERKGISVVCCTSTDSALRVLQEYKWLLYMDNASFRIVTDMTRDEEGTLVRDAGIVLVQKLRKNYGYTHPIMIFCGNAARAKETCASKGLVSNVFVTSSEQEIRDFVGFKPLPK